jgi:hypothetical protein
LEDVVAQHRAGKAVVAKFGEDGKRLLPGQMVFDEDIRKLEAAVLSVPVDATGDTVVLKSSPEARSGMEVPMRKVAGQWKPDRLGYVNSMNRKETEKAIAAFKSHAAVMDAWGKRVAAGAYADVEAAKTGLGMLEMEAKGRPEGDAGGAGAKSSGGAAGALVVENRWSVKARGAGVTAVQKAAYGEMARLEDCALMQWDEPGAPDVADPREGTTDATVRLMAMGMEVVPLLAEALDDTTPTRTVPESGRARNAEPWTVNVVVGQMIRRMCGRDFVVEAQGQQHTLGEVGAHPELAEAFAQEIDGWVAANRKRTEVERKVADVSDGWFRNRLDAVEWLGQKKEKAGRAAIEADVDRTLAAMEKKQDSLKEAELSECALALGRIGDKASLPKVRAACARLLADWDWRETSGGARGSMDVSTLFMGYEGLALLGEKAAAVKVLDRVEGAYSGKWEASMRAEFEGRLGKARGW